MANAQVLMADRLSGAIRGTDGSIIRIGHAVDPVGSSSLAQNDKNSTSNSNHKTATVAPLLPSLIPIRINVVSADQSMRIVQTILWDVNSLATSMRNDHSSSCSLLETTAHELANHILSDMEVHGMSRTARHFTGRVDLWNDKAQQLIQEQIQSLLQSAVETWNQQARSNQKKRRREATFKEEEEGSVKTTRKSHNEKSTSQETSEIKENESEPSLAGDKDNQPTDKVPVPPGESFRSSEANNKTKGSGSDQKKSARRPLIPIRLRIIYQNTRIHDDFEWDCSLQHVYSPLQMAMDLGRDLKLPEEAVQAIAIEITEQIMAHSGKGGESSSSTTTPTNWSDETAPHLFRTLQQRHKESKVAMMLAPPSTPLDIASSNTTAAWEMDARELTQQSAILLAHQKPSSRPT